MTSPHHSVARLLACAATLVLSLALATPAASQEDEEEPRRFCRVGRPQPACEVVLVAQFSYYPRILRSSDLDSPFEWEIGALVNRGPTYAVGGTVVLGVDGNGRRVAVKGRYRRWISPTAAVDASGGLAMANRGWATTVTDRGTVGVTGDVAVGFTDWVSVGVRGDLLWSHAASEPVGATYGTVRLGTGAGLVVSILGAVLAVVAVTVSG